MIEYAIINDKYWQKGKLIGIHNRDDYIFQMNDRNEMLSEDKLRINSNGNDMTLHEIMDNVFVEVIIVSRRGNFAAINIPKGNHDFSLRKLTRINQLVSKKFR